MTRQLRCSPPVDPAGGGGNAAPAGQRPADQHVEPAWTGPGTEARARRSPLLRQWTLIQQHLVPPLLEVGRSRRPAVWSLGDAGDAVAVALAFGDASPAGPAALSMFASCAGPHARSVSFPFADVRHVPPRRRDEWLRRRNRRWVPDEAITEAVRVAEPREPVDLVTIRSAVGAPPPVAEQWADRLRPGGRLLVIGPVDLRPGGPPVLEPIGHGPAGWRLYRRRAGGDPPPPGDDRRPPLPDQRAPDTLAGQRLQDELVADHLRLARAMARRFAHRGERLDDLEQVAFLALVKASRRFDPSRDVRFSSFATTSILGELKRHFRDKAWTMRVPRSMQEAYLSVKQARDELTHRLGAAPSIAEIAAHLDVSVDTVLEAMEAGNNYWPASLDTAAPDDNSSTAVPVPEPGFERSLELYDLQRLLPRLDRREQVILERIFFEERTQREVAQEMQISQMQVSRLLAHTLAKLRRWATR